MISGVESTQQQSGNYAVTMLKKQNDNMKMQGQQALQLIESANVDASPHKGRSIDTVA